MNTFFSGGTSKRNVSMSGTRSTSPQVAKETFLQRQQAERAERLIQKQRQDAAIKIQRFTRAHLAILKTKAALRKDWDDKITFWFQHAVVKPELPKKLSSILELIRQFCLFFHPRKNEDKKRLENLAMAFLTCLNVPEAKSINLEIFNNPVLLKSYSYNCQRFATLALKNVLTPPSLKTPKEPTSPFSMSVLLYSTIISLSDPLAWTFPNVSEECAKLAQESLKKILSKLILMDSLINLRLFFK